MLLKIDSSLVDYLKDNSSKPNLINNEVQALNNLSIAHRDKKHILFGSLDVVEFLKDFKPLDDTALGIFSNLFKKFTFMGIYEEMFDNQILIKSREHKFLKKFVKEKVIFEIPITDFLDIESISRTALIGEDSTDCEFYEGLAKQYITENYGISAINLNFHHVNGGGVNTWKSLRYYSENKKISLTITDSDKRYPTGNVGETLRKLRTEYNKHKNNTITDLVELKVREKENLIPPSVYLYCCNSSDKSRLENFMLLEDSNKHSEKLFYLDYKEGLNVKSYKRDSQLQGYIEEMVKDFPHLATCSLEDIDSLSDDYRIIEGISMNVSDYFSVGVFYEGLEKELEDKLMIEKIPAEVIDDLRNSIDKKNKMFRHMPESFQVHLEEICKKLIDWGCANSSFIAT